jgi:hypothetical protein
VVILIVCTNHLLANAACQLNFGAFLIEVFFPPLLLEITSALQWTIDLNIFAFLSNMVAELFVSHFSLIFVAAILGTP